MLNISKRTICSIFMSVVTFPLMKSFKIISVAFDIQEYMYFLLYFKQIRILLQTQMYKLSRYNDPIILNRFIEVKSCSTTIFFFAISWFCAFASFDNFFFFVSFVGKIFYKNAFKLCENTINI